MRLSKAELCCKLLKDLGIEAVPRLHKDLNEGFGIEIKMNKALGLDAYLDAAKLLKAVANLPEKCKID